jgi:branched-chain amino acid transport system substrate-binding protein
MKRLLAVLLVVLMCVSLVACSSKSDQSSQGDQSSQSSQSSKSGGNGGTGGSEDASGDYWADLPTFKIGILTNLTGAGKETGDRTRWAADYAVEQINEKGGVLGKKLEVEYFDVGGDQQGFINAMQRAVNTEGISATIGYPISSFTVGATDIILESKIPNITGGDSANVRDLKNPYIWQIRMIDEIKVKLLAKLSYEEYNVKNPAVVWMTEAAGQSQHDAYVAAMKELGGTIAADIGFDRTTTSDFGPIMTQVMNSGSDGLVCFMTTGNDGVLFGQTISQSGYPHPVAGSSGLFEYSYLALVQGAADGFYGIAEYNGSADTPGLQEYIAELNRRNPDLGKPGWIENVHYDALFLLAEAAKIAGSTNPEHINEGLGQIKGFQGMLSSFTSREDHSFSDYVWVAEIQNNEVVIKKQIYRD